MSAVELSMRARNTLSRHHPDRDRLWQEWVDAGRNLSNLPEFSDVDLLTYAATLSDRELLRFGNFGRRSLAEVRGLCDPWPGLVETQ